MHPDIANHDLPPEMQQFLADLAMSYFGNEPQYSEQPDIRVLVAEMLIRGATRREVADALGLPLPCIPTLFAAPKALH